MTISQIIEERLRLMGTSQAEIARMTGTNPTQMGVFLKGQGTLPNDVLEKCLLVVGIDVSLYTRRIHQAMDVADILINKGVKIDNLTKDDLLYFTKMNNLRFLIDVPTINDYMEIVDSGLVDPESTFPYFKALTAYMVNIRIQNQQKGRITSSLAISSLHGIFLNPIGALGSAVAGAVVKKTQKGNISLFSKQVRESLNEKAMDYIKNGQV